MKPTAQKISVCSGATLVPFPSFLAGAGALLSHHACTRRSAWCARSSRSRRFLTPAEATSLAFIDWGGPRSAQDLSVRLDVVAEVHLISNISIHPAPRRRPVPSSLLPFCPPSCHQFELSDRVANSACQLHVALSSLRP